MKKLLPVFISLALLLTACRPLFAAKPETAEIFAMDTVMDLTVYGSEGDLSAAEKRIYELENLFSATKEESDIYHLNKLGETDISSDTADIIASALELCRMTDGALDISVYPAVRAWGFTSGEYRVPTDDELDELKQLIGYDRLQFDYEARHAALPEGFAIDLGSVAKGYAGDKICELLSERGVTSALLNLGGNVQALGTKPNGSMWRVAVQNPLGDGSIGRLEISDEAIITAGNYIRFFEQDGVRYWHIIDPADAAPARSGLVSVSVVSQSGVFSDGISTALFVMGLEKAEEFWRENEGFEVIFVCDNGKIFITEGLEKRFVPEDSAVDVEVIRRD